MAFYQFQCESCDEITTVTLNCTYTTIGSQTYQKLNPPEIERGCWHICIDDKMSFLFNRLVM